MSRELDRASLDANISIVPITGCWMWMGTINDKGYGTTWVGKEVRVHRESYRMLRGPLIEGLVLDHLCRNRWCVNPAHLEQVTQRENILRGEGATARNAKKRLCAHGHELVGSNLIERSDGRECRACRRRISLAYYHRNKALS